MNCAQWMNLVEFSRKDVRRGVTIPSTVSDELCISIGIDIGDAYLTRWPGTDLVHGYYRYAVCQGYPNEWFGARFFLSSLLTKLYGLPPKLWRHRTRMGIILGYDSKAIFTFKSRVLNFHVGEGKARKVTLPAIFEELTVRRKALCLLGLHYADGTLTFSRGRTPVVAFSTASHRLATQIQGFFDCSGYRTEKMPYGCQGVARHYLKIRIAGESQFLKWLEEIGLLNPIHIARYATWKRFGYCPPALQMAQYFSILADRADPNDFPKKSGVKSKNHDLLRDTVVLATLLAAGGQPIEIEKLEKSACLVDAFCTISAMVDLGLLKWEEGRRVVSTDKGIDLIESFINIWNSFQRYSRFLPILPKTLAGKS